MIVPIFQMLRNSPNYPFKSFKHMINAVRLENDFSHKKVRNNRDFGMSISTLYINSANSLDHWFKVIIISSLIHLLLNLFVNAYGISDIFSASISDVLLKVIQAV